MDKKTGGSAYPSLGNVGHNSEWLSEEGMTLRDHFAGQALIGLLTRYGHEGSERAAALSYELADAMIAEREKQ